jgi:hypothetical protein
MPLVSLGEPLDGYCPSARSLGPKRRSIRYSIKPVNKKHDISKSSKSIHPVHVGA